MRANLTAITIQESKRLIELEKAISRGKKTFVEVGTALAEIRDLKLYKSEYKTFEDYCNKKWGWKRQRAYQLIESAEVAATLPENVKHVLQNDRQASALAKVEPEKRVEVIERAKSKADSEDREMTARDIRAASPTPPDPEEETPRVRTADEEWKEALGGTIPEIPNPKMDGKSDALYAAESAYSRLSKSDKIQFREDLNLQLIA